ncbi:TetR/AcrR family transcriptional regulator C-terminal domain-containing protein [Kibdelosporangium philippinense]|uniref:TetR/AcrR family transcriptional regulator C-terminal domain-containing protein n=1 Tax=Kibdelosporangium philippinense TaxID=211113 RepID=A0ABS8ZXC6_9PSEU|nr:TetR/AcrR family transcriptional regulator C-terminal domain-containing protein [Kibdelosporangium philippinense]MCE7011351.1 TetR/AcrR family transcriptional regulator C-terminal domain-containing protein [Kibdelosporangium philippinense]
MPRYLDIAAELKRQIAAGELVPGAKVPSVRKLAATWGVATATAAKALTVVAQEGLINAEPRSGFVVAGSKNVKAPKWSRQHDLTRDRLVRAAIDIADAEGLAAVSMRSVTARLGVATMAPYRHVKGKDELVILMADAAFGERGYPSKGSLAWRPRLELAARTLWSLFKRHPWLAQLGPITRPLPLPNLTAHSEWMLVPLEALGLTAAEMLDITVLIFSYTQGIAVHLEREQQAFSTSGMSDEDWMDSTEGALNAITAMGRFPTFSKMLATLNAEGYDLILDNLFEQGLQALLDGLASRMSTIPCGELNTRATNNGD